MTELTSIKLFEPCVIHCIVINIACFCLVHKWLVYKLITESQFIKYVKDTSVLFLMGKEAANEENTVPFAVQIMFPCNQHISV